MRVPSVLFQGLVAGDARHMVEGEMAAAALDMSFLEAWSSQTRVTITRPFSRHFLLPQRFAKRASRRLAVSIEVSRLLVISDFSRPPSSLNLQGRPVLGPRSPCSWYQDPSMFGKSRYVEEEAGAASFLQCFGGPCRLT